MTARSHLPTGRPVPPLEDEIRRSASILVGAVFSGMLLGAAIPGSGVVAKAAIPMLALQTLLTVGALPRFSAGISVKNGLALFTTHHLLATVPLAAVAVAWGLRNPLGLGLFAIAAGPPAALVPVYADVLGLAVAPMVAYCLFAYAVSLVLTPLLFLSALGVTVDPRLIAATLGGGLVVPALVSRILHRQVVAVPRSTRRNIVGFSSFVVCFGLGRAVVHDLATGSSLLLVLLILTLLVSRLLISGLVAARFGKFSSELTLAAGFKNLGLAAVVASTLSEPRAALPALLAFPIDALYFLRLAGRRPAPPRGGRMYLLSTERSVP